MRRIREKMHCKTIEPYLSSWIAEAALGLDLKEAKVSSSKACPVTEKNLKEAAQLVKKHTGSEVILSLDPRPIRGLGVVLSSLDDKVSFNNQVEIRLRRFDRVIRTMIQEYT
jgi:V/A-type H+-transporting ATPase subunit E